MKTEKVLEKWATACDWTDIRWYLFKETLLCANGYHCLPTELPYAQIAVFAKDLPELVEFVFPALPSKWTLDKKHFIGNKRELVFFANHKPILEITVLYGVEDEHKMHDFTTEIKKITKKANRKIKWKQRVYNLFKKLLGGLYTKTFGKLTKRSIRKQIETAFTALVDLAGTSNESAEFYCDSMTNKKPVLFEKTLFCDAQTLPCTLLGAKKETAESIDAMDDDNNEEALDNIQEEVYYPVFSGYRDYLAVVYGDYENGLTDEIGCGLTVEEKEELKKHQARCFEALTFLQELSTEFNLRYYLIAGSVLGAVRHGGFIPWDDDIDIGIRIEEIEEFEKIVKEHLPNRLPEGFTLEQSGADNPYPRMFSKICYEGRCCIDLWPLVPTFREGFKASFLWYFGKIITKVHYQKIGHKVTKFHKIAKFASILFSDKAIMRMARRNERRYANLRTPAYINLYSIYRRRKETFRRVWLDDRATAMFNGLEVPVVGHTKLYLTHLYGNYMTFPLPWKRTSRHIARFSSKESELTTSKT